MHGACQSDAKRDLIKKLQEYWIFRYKPIDTNESSCYSFVEKVFNVKVVAKPVEMIAWFNEEGKIRPMKFKIEDGEKYEVIKVERVIKSAVEKHVGNVMLVFDCQSEIGGENKIYQLKYEIETNHWILFKI